MDRWPCGHLKQLASRRDGLYVATGCAICAAHCPVKSCGAWPKHGCRTPTGYTARTHKQRFAAAGLSFERDWPAPLTSS